MKHPKQITGLRCSLVGQFPCEISDIDFSQSRVYHKMLWWELFLKFNANRWVMFFLDDETSHSHSIDKWSIFGNHEKLEFDICKQPLNDYRFHCSSLERKRYIIDNSSIFGYILWYNISNLNFGIPFRFFGCYLSAKRPIGLRYRHWSFREPRHKSKLVRKFWTQESQF